MIFHFVAQGNAISKPLHQASNLIVENIMIVELNIVSLKELHAQVNRSVQSVLTRVVLF